jgi:type IX secretion system PorP/SprF family membrane protein
MQKKLYLFFLLLLLLLTSNIKTYAQDLTFSQFYEQPLLRNPALSGVFKGDIRVAGAYRDQWSSITVPYRTGAMSVEYKIPIGTHNDVFTIGSQFTLDAAGDIRLKRTQALPALSFHKSLSDVRDMYLSVAFMGGPVFSQFDQTQIKFGDQYVGGNYNPSNPTAQVLQYSGYNYWDMGTGICFSSELNNSGRFYIGASLSHFNKPVIHSVTGNDATFLAPKITFNLGLNAPLNDVNRMIVFADYLTENGHRQLLGGCLYGWDIQKYFEGDPFTFYIGSFLRWGDALIPLVKMDFNHTTIGISYDVNISKLKVVSNWRGGLEVTASYTGFLKIHNSTLDKVRCVAF